MAARRKSQSAEQPQLVPAAPGTAIAPIDRARQVLKLDERKAQLVDLAKDSARIVEITNAAGYQECHGARMRLKGTRVDIEKAGKEARDDANKFSKAVITVEDELISLISPEEKRLQALQDAWDTAREAERQEKARIERERIEAEQRALQNLRELPLRAMGESAAEIRLRLADLNAMDFSTIPEGVREQGIRLIGEVCIQLGKILDDKVAAEGEAKRLAAERAELEAQRKQREADDRARDEAERKKREADDAAQREQMRKEREEHEAKLAADRKRIDEERAELDKLREAQRKRDQEEADRKAAAERKRLDDEAAAERTRRDQEAAAAQAKRLEELKASATNLAAAACEAHAFLCVLGEADNDITITLGYAIENDAKPTKTKKAA